MPRKSQPKGNTVRQSELTSLIGLRDSDGDRLLLLRVDRPNGTRGYMLKVGTGSVFLTAGDLEGLSTVIRFELLSANQFRFFAIKSSRIVAAASSLTIVGSGAKRCPNPR
jgi:hypothetical protein